MKAHADAPRIGYRGPGVTSGVGPRGSTTAVTSVAFCRVGGLRRHGERGLPLLPVVEHAAADTVDGSQYGVYYCLRVHCHLGIIIALLPMVFARLPARPFVRSDGVGNAQKVVALRVIIKRAPLPERDAALCAVGVVGVQSTQSFSDAALAAILAYSVVTAIGELVVAVVGAGLHFAGRWPWWQGRRRRIRWQGRNRWRRRWQGRRWRRRRRGRIGRWHAKLVRREPDRAQVALLAQIVHDPLRTHGGTRERRHQRGLGRGANGCGRGVRGWGRTAFS